METLTLTDIAARLVSQLDTDPEREDLIQTPERFSRFWEEFLKPAPFKLTTFPGHNYNEMVVQSDIPFYSICEHHLLPFFGSATVAYIPKDRIVGLSKLARTVDHFSRRLQNQERITRQVVDYLSEQLDPKGVGVILTARHLCMEMRGVRKPGAATTTSAVQGLFKTSPATRAEFLRFVR